ncbi:MAG: Arc family DNA-binding protein [Acidobacteriota bacterium]
MKPFLLRLPDDLWERLAEAAKAERRSLHAEILRRLERSIEEEGS